MSNGANLLVSTTQFQFVIGNKKYRVHQTIEEVKEEIIDLTGEEEPPTKRTKLAERRHMKPPPLKIPNRETSEKITIIISDEKSAEYYRNAPNPSNNRCSPPFNWNQNTPDYIYSIAATPSYESKSTVITP